MSEKMMACFRKESLPYFHTGLFGQYIFPKLLSEVITHRIPVIKVRVLAFTVHEEFLFEIPNSPLKKTPLVADSAHQFVQYSEQMSYEVIKDEAEQALLDRFNIKIRHSYFWNMYYDEPVDEPPNLVYFFLIYVDLLNLKSIVKDGQSLYLRSVDQIRVLLPEWNIPHIDYITLENLIDKKPWRSLLSDFTTQKRSLSTEAGNQNYNIGVVIGRFQPFHNGHLSMITAILEEVHQLTIVIGSAQYSSTVQNPFSAEERIEMIKRVVLYQKIPLHRVNIVSLPDYHDFSAWTQALITKTSPFDILYSNNEWIQDLCLIAGKQVRPLPKISFTQYNGSFIRQCLRMNQPIDQLVPSPVFHYLEEIQAQVRLQSITI